MMEDKELKRRKAVSATRIKSVFTTCRTKLLTMASSKREAEDVVVRRVVTSKQRLP